MAIPWNQFDRDNAQCIYRNLDHLVRRTDGPCPFGKAAHAAWVNRHLDGNDPDAVKQWVEAFMTYDQWALLYDHCVTTPGKNGQLLDSLAAAGKNKDLLT